MLIPGVRTVHPRSVWEESGFRVTGPANPGVFDDLVGHYPGASDVPDRDYRGHVYVDPSRFYNDLFGYFRAMQRAYLRDRGYSVGYQFGIDYLGGLTVLRGFDVQNAANAGGKLAGNWNHRSLSAQFVTDIDRPATDLALYTFAMLAAHLRHHGHRATIRSHDFGEWTQCAGPLRAQLAAGMGEPDYWVRRGPPAGAAPLPWYLAPDPEEDDMQTYVMVPPPELQGRGWPYLVCGPSGSRLANSLDLGLPLKQLVDEYRLQQYHDALVSVTALDELRSVTAAERTRFLAMVPKR